MSRNGSLSVEIDQVYSRLEWNEDANFRNLRRSSSLHEAAPATPSSATCASFYLNTGVINGHFNGEIVLSP